MQISVTGKRHLELPEGIKDYIEDRLHKIQRFFSSIDEGHVVLKTEKYLNTAEVSVSGKNIHLYAEGASDENLFVAMDRASDRVEIQLKKQRDKMSEHKAPRTSELIENEEKLNNKNSEDDELIPEMYDIKPMSLEEASMQFKITEEEFLVFQNSKTEQVNVIFKNKDGNMGLIEPDGGK